jgi:hypothetical protein
MILEPIKMARNFLTWMQRREALLSAREILAAAIMAGREDVPRRFLITDEEGELLDIVDTKEVLPKVFRIP